MRLPMLILALLGLAACSGGRSDTEAGGVTTAEAKALDDAAEMLERQRLPEEALRPPAPAEGQSAPMQQAPAK